MGKTIAPETTCPIPRRTHLTVFAQLPEEQPRLLFLMKAFMLKPYGSLKVLFQGRDAAIKKTQFQSPKTYHCLMKGVYSMLSLLDLVEWGKIGGFVISYRYPDPMAYRI